MTDPFTQHGAFSWCELMTTNVAAAKDFYAKLFDWQTRDMDMGEMVYTVVKAGNQEVGGIMAMPPDVQGMSPAWGTYVTVADVDATARKADDLGGTVLLPPRDIPDVGRFCVIQDPQGAMISAISYARQA